MVVNIQDISMYLIDAQATSIQTNKYVSNEACYRQLTVIYDLYNNSC